MHIRETSAQIYAHTNKHVPVFKELGRESQSKRHEATRYPTSDSNVNILSVFYFWL